MLHLHHPEETLKDEARRAFDAAFQIGEQIRETNGRIYWTDEEIDAAATELRRRLLGENKDV